MSNYNTLLSTYNFEPNKLLAKHMLSDNVPTLDAVDIQRFALDWRFYNLNLKEKENRKNKTKALEACVETHGTSPGLVNFAALS